MKPGLKAVILIGMGLFLYSRIVSGTLYFYINERFLWLTIFAALGFILIGVSYRYHSEDADDCGHDHEGHHHHGQLGWLGLLLIVSPIVLGLLVPPRPLGAAAMTNRDVSIESLTSAAAPENSNVLAKPKSEKNVLDWIIEYRAASDPAVLNGEEVKLVGFVYRDERFEPHTFMVSRFVLSCCAADAAPLGLIVNWPDSPNLADDQWIEVTGYLEAGEFDGESMPIVIADDVVLTDIPNQPYLYPF